MTDAYHYESFQLQTDCLGYASFNFTLFSFYKYSLVPTLQIYDITPYGSIFYLGRPIARNGITTLGMGGFYTFTLIRGYIQHGRHMRSIYSSLMDSFLQKRDGYAPYTSPYNNDFENKDEYWVYDIFE